MSARRARFTLPFLIFVTPVLLWLFLLIVLPHIDLLLMSFRIENDAGAMVWSLINYLNFFDEPVYWRTFARTAVYAILTTLITFAVSLPVAFYITKVVSPRISGFLSLLLLHALLGQRTGAGLRVDDPAARKRRHQPLSAQNSRSASAARGNALQRHHHGHGPGLHLHAVHGGALDIGAGKPG
jgi:hypothetical protein